MPDKEDKIDVILAIEGDFFPSFIKLSGKHVVMHLKEGYASASQ